MEDEKILNGIHSKNQILIKYKMKFYSSFCLVLSIICLLEFALIFYLINKQTISIPYVVEIGRDGSASYIDNASTTLSKWKPSTATIIKNLEDFVISLRGVSTDLQVQQDRIKKVYAYSTENALKVAQEYLLQNNPIDRRNKERVEISVYAVTPNLNGSENIYQLDWNEKIYNLNDSIKSEANYRAVITIKTYLPKTKNIQEINPLGIYLTRLEISQIKDGYILL